MKNKLSPRHIISILAVVLAAAVAIGSTLAYLTDKQSVTNTFTVGDLDIALEEPDYPFKDGKPNELFPGDSYTKNPTVKAMDGDGYMRMIVEFQTASGGPITDPAIIALIEKTLYYDPTGAIATFGATKDPEMHITEDELTALGLSTYNATNFYAGTLTGNKKVFNYKNTATGDIFKETVSATLFTTLYVPCDWNQNTIKDIQGYKVVVHAEAIQAANFENAGEAFAALDAATNVLTDYDAVDFAGNTKPATTTSTTP